MPKRVLVADDDPEMLRAVAIALQQMGADVVRASSGDQLLEHLADDAFSLVVADVSMPALNGLSAMYSARRAGVRTPVIVITALSDERISEQVRALGDDAVLLRKPFDLTELEAAAARLLTRE